MTDLLEIREKIKLYYSKFETFILPVVKFLLAFIVLNTLNGRMRDVIQLQGNMAQLDNIAVVLILSLMCSFLPTGCIIFFSVVFSLMYMYALSVEVALVGFCLYLVMFLMFFRFSPKDSLVVVLTPLLFVLRIPYVMPLAAGLVCGPASIVSLGCGVGVHYLLQTVIDNAPAVVTMSDDAATARLRLVLDGFIRNKEMLVMIAAFAITALTVYLIRRMSVDHSWTIAMVSGAMINLVILLIGDLIYDINISVGGAVLGILLALAVGKIIEFFSFCVDYSRTEKVQFEDDEYYYYVKAVPKMALAPSAKTVKKINSQNVRNAAAGGRSASGAQGRNGTGQIRSGQGSGARRVTTERTAGRRDRYGASGSAGRNSYRGGQGVTIGSARPEDDLTEETEDFDGLY